MYDKNILNIKGFFDFIGKGLIFQMWRFEFLNNFVL